MNDNLILSLAVTASQNTDVFVVRRYTLPFNFSLFFQGIISVYEIMSFIAWKSYNPETSPDLHSTEGLDRAHLEV